MGARKKKTGGMKGREEGPEESLGLTDAWMERIDERVAGVRWRAGYLEGGRFHPRHASSSSQIAKSSTAVVQSRTAAQRAAAAHTGRPRGPQSFGDANCMRSCRMHHAHRNCMGSTPVEGFDSNVIALLYSMAVAPS